MTDAATKRRTALDKLHAAAERRKTVSVLEHDSKGRIKKFESIETADAEVITELKQAVAAEVDAIIAERLKTVEAVVGRLVNRKQRLDLATAEVGEIDAEVARLQGIAAEKSGAAKADEQKHVLDQDWQKQKRLWSEVSKINEAVDKLLTRRADIELNGLPEPQRPAGQPVPRSKGDWEIKNLSQPEYPAGARRAGDQAKLDETFEQFTEFFCNKMKQVYADSNIDPNDTASIASIAQVQGEILASFLWASRRARELEQRVAELEERGTLEYRGVYELTRPYPRNTAITHKGCLWIARRTVEPGEFPGDSQDDERPWQLAVKQGRPGRDASEPERQR